ncbi:MAG TPA: protein translocase subunit SecD [Kofleriaceae bacterium]|jgi:preprotein translocase subunit SecD
MDRSLKWRTLGLVIGLLLCVGILAPSVAGGPVRFLGLTFSKQINLGLDLRGGLYLTYGIDLGKTVDDRASNIKRDLDTRFIDEKIHGEVKTPRASHLVPVGSVVVTFEADSVTHKDEIKSEIQTDYGRTIDWRDCTPADGPNALCFNVTESYAEEIEKSALANAVLTIRERINQSGVAEASVVEKGSDIIVELPGDPDSPAIREMQDTIARTAKLEFKVVDNASKYMRDLAKHVGNVDKKGRATNKQGVASDPLARSYDVFTRYDSWKPESSPQEQYDVMLWAYDRTQAMPLDWAKKHGCYDAAKSEIVDGKTDCKIEGRQVLEWYLFGDKELGLQGLTQTDPAFKVPDDKQFGYEKHEPDDEDEEELKKGIGWRTYYLDRAVRLTGSEIEDARPSQNPQTGRPLVELEFTRHGGRVFGDLTAQIEGKKLATILDDTVKSAPVIETAIRGGRASITMGTGDPVRAEAEREALVNVLKTGSLPARLIEQNRSQVGPTLGADAIAKTRLSFIMGIILVIIIMVGVYQWSGTIAVFAVVFHIMMTLAVMALFGATLTLPGIAAIVLSIGMEVDGNILIYERIRDELLLGKSVRGAVDLGFSRAFSAILDGQLTTAAAGWVLLQYGSGPIKGFAVMLLVGVFTTLSTNIWVTRIFFDWYIAKKKGQMATISI